MLRTNDNIAHIEMQLRELEAAIATVSAERPNQFLDKISTRIVAARAVSEAVTTYEEWRTALCSIAKMILNDVIFALYMEDMPIDVPASKEAVSRVHEGGFFEASQMLPTAFGRKNGARFLANLEASGYPVRCLNPAAMKAATVAIADSQD